MTVSQNWRTLVYEKLDQMASKRDKFKFTLSHIVIKNQRTRDREKIWQGESKKASKRERKREKEGGTKEKEKERRWERGKKSSK